MEESSVLKYEALELELGTVLRNKDLIATVSGGAL